MNTKQQISECFSIYQQFEWLLNCYVLDFFTDNHWNKLPNSWQSILKGLSSKELIELLDYNERTHLAKIWPLSILALKRVLTKHSLSRKIVDLKIPNASFMNDQHFLKLFWKGVKAKKRHEISIMTKICYESARKTKCFYIVDVGSGLGHLSRILNYGYGLKVCTIEAQTSLSQQAKILDNEFERSLQKYNIQNETNHTTIHLNKRLEASVTAEDFLDIVKVAFNETDENFKFGIVGLHPCGDLAATLLRLFKECNNVQFINIVGCCYMKLSTLHGFPLSDYCSNHNYTLSYHSREIACHAIENYIEKLAQNECWRLKIHTYRAILEKLIVESYPELRHCALNNVKYTEDLSFENYCQKATKKFNSDFSFDNSREIEKLLIQWRDVVVFYSLRLLFAPFIESIIHLDRLLFIEESGYEATIKSVFDSKISPRTHVLSATK